MLLNSRNLETIFFGSNYDNYFRISDCPFVSGNICHCQERLGHEIFGHFCIGDDVIDSCRKYVEDKSVKTVTLILGAEKVKYCEASEFKNECSQYFEKYYKFLAVKAPLIIPSIIPVKYAKVIHTLSDWCKMTSKVHNIKGFVLHNFLIKDLYLKMYNDPLDDLCRKLRIEGFPATPTITVYNPNERIIFLIRIAENEDIENEITLSGAELKILLLLIGNELINTAIKVIPLVVTGKEVQCIPCKSHLIPRTKIENVDFFMNWCGEKSADFDIKATDNLKQNEAIKIIAKIVSCIGATKINNFLPAFTTEKERQMKEALLLLTPEQIDILHSEDKHMIIDGPYGSGKSIIGRIKAKMIADNLPEDEFLYYISYDTRSALKNDIQRSNPKIKIYPDEEKQKGEKLSHMLTDILKRNGNGKGRRKINLIIDEYDGEKLDKLEAYKLNKIINTEYKKTFQNTVILLISQSMKKKRWTYYGSIDSNRFDLLEQMQRKKLTLVMRNSVQINNLLEVTKQVLEKVQTRYHLKERKEKKKKEGKPKALNESPKKQDNETNKSERGAMVQEKPTKSISESLEGLKTKQDSSIAQIGANDLEIDEALDLAGTPTAKDGNQSYLENSFKYEKATKLGHKGESKLPVLFELYHFDNEFEKIYSLAAIFENLQITRITANSKHVLLHFNMDNEMLRLAFKLLDFKQKTKVTDKITNSYKDFKNDSLEKYIFVGNFRTFRGLEHPRITIIIDRDIYSLQHFLVECIARCTTDLNIVLLGFNKSLDNITLKWKEGISGEPLIDTRRIKLNNKRNQSKDPGAKANEEITIDTFSQEYRKLQESFNRHSFQNIEREDLVSKEEVKIAIER